MQWHIFKETHALLGSAFGFATAGGWFDRQPDVRPPDLPMLRLRRRRGGGGVVGRARGRAVLMASPGSGGARVARERAGAGCSRPRPVRRVRSTVEGEGRPPHVGWPGVG